MLIRKRLITNLEVSRSKSWIATTGQLSYELIDDTYTSGLITVYVGGICNFTGINFTEDSPSRFMLLCDVSEIPEGIEVIAIYR